MNDTSNLPVVASPPTAMQWPVNAMDRMALCRELATARLVPPAFQKSPADLFLVMNTCERLRLDFFLTIGECYVISGKVGFSGKMAAAMLNSSGMLAERLSYVYAGEGDERTITVSARLHGETTSRSVEVRLGNVKTQNAQWTKQPDQQLGYSGARTWGRLHLSEVMLGMQFDDEVRDMVDVTPHREPTPMHPPDLQQGTTIEQPSEAEYIEPYRMVAPAGDEDWRQWAQAYIANARTARTVAELDRWAAYNVDATARMAEIEPKMHRMLNAAIEKQRFVVKQEERA